MSKLVHLYAACTAAFVLFPHTFTLWIFLCCQSEVWRHTCRKCTSGSCTASTHAYTYKHTALSTKASALWVLLSARCASTWLLQLLVWLREGPTVLLDGVGQGLFGGWAASPAPYLEREVGEAAAVLQQQR